MLLYTSVPCPRVQLVVVFLSMYVLFAPIPLVQFRYIMVELLALTVKFPVIGGLGLVRNVCWFVALANPAVLFAHAR